METAAKPKYLLEESGDVVLNQKDGKRIVLGRYDEEKKHLEWESKDISVKYRAGVMNAIGTDADGTSASTRTVRTMSIKGEALDSTKGIPPRPKMDKNLGDATPEVVEWYFEHKPKEAYVRYGVKLDAKGQPVRGNVRRKSIQTTDYRELDDSQIEPQKDGAHEESKGPVVRQGIIEDHKNAIIASRATHMTFLKEEQIGYDGNEDDDYEAMQEEGAE